MDNLIQARVELARLEAKEQDLLKQLLEVHYAVSAQRTKISELIRLGPPPIDGLPTELLVSILDLTIRAYPDRERQWELARVSRRWRDVILENPVFWTTIDLLALSTSAIKAQLKRSGNLLLDVIIKVEDSPRSICDLIESRMYIVMPHVHRWRALDMFDITTYYGSDHDNGRTVGEIIDKAIYGLKLPSLKHAVIQCTDGTVYPKFLSPTCAPSLEYLELNNCPEQGGSFALPSTLKTLKLSFKPWDLIARYPSFISTQTLTTLSLSGRIVYWPRQPNSIQFPVLKTLTLTISRTNDFMHAITTPNLEHFNFFLGHEDHYPSPSVVFGGLESKFTSVHHVTFYGLAALRDHRPDHDPNASPLCEAFPNVRHVEIAPEDLAGLLMARSCRAESTHNLCPVDLWKDLQSLTLRGPSYECINGLDQLPEWLMQRQKSGLPPLHIKLAGFGSFPSSVRVAEYFRRLHGCLREYCQLQFDFPITMEISLSTAADSSFEASFQHFPELSWGI
ncbi:hypothetical protein J3A83DRAFT_4188085 [Scleroderma citrinum]